MSHRKIPAQRGMYWCLQSWRNLKASPQPIVSMSLWLSLGVFLPLLNFFVVLLLTVFYGGIISAVHKKTLGEKVLLGDFFNGFKSLPRFLGLFMVGFPTVLFAIFSSTVMISALGPEMAQQLAQAGQAPSKELIEAIAPVLLGVILKLLPMAVVIAWIVFLAVPRVMLDKRLGLLALWDAAMAMLGNLAALLVFSACILLSMFVATFVLSIPLALIANAGAGALAGLLQSLLVIFISTLGMALYFNAMYLAWCDIFMTENTPPIFEQTDGSDTQIEV